MKKSLPFAALAIVLGYTAYLLYRLLFYKTGPGGGARVVGLYLIPGFLLLLILRAGAFFKRPGISLSSLKPALKISLSSRLLHTLLFLAVVFVLKQADLSWKDFDRSGMFITTNLLCRLVFSVYFSAACFGAGKIAVERLFGKEEAGGAGENFILYFFTGAAGLALAGIAALFLGVLNAVFALTVMTPLIFYAAPFIQEPVRLLYANARRSFNESPFYFSIYFIFSWILAGAVLFVTLSKGLYPGSLNNDVWEHYLHYYREVLRTGHWGPNELWYHFYISKGAGLFYLAGALSDVFAVPLVSLCFIFAVCVMLFQCVRTSMKNTLLALTAVIVFLCLYDGDLFKHHAALAGYLIFLVWVTERALLGKKALKVYAACGALASFYLGFYQPAVFVLAALFFLSAALWFFVSKEARTKIFFSIALGIAGTAGMLFAFTVNFGVTGLFLDSPIRFFWRFADTEKFLRVIGPSGAAYFLQVNSDLAATAGFFNAAWAMKIFRVPVLLLIFPAPLIAVGLFFAGREIFLGNSSIKKTAPGLIFILCALVFGQAAQVASLDRLYVFIVFFTLFAAFFILNCLLNAFPEFYKKSVSALVLLFLGITAFSGAIDKIHPIRRQAAVRYALGRFSFADVLGETDRFFSTNNIALPTVMKFHREIGANKRIFNIGFDPGPAYSFPLPGIVSEPSYTLGPRAEEIIFGPPEETKRSLKAMGLDHFMINFNDWIFTGLAFSRLFNSENLSRYFRVVSEDRGTFLLTWRESGQEENIPEDLIRFLDLKRSAVLLYPFSDQFRQDLLARVEKFFRDGGSLEKGEGLEKALEEALLKDRADPPQIKSNQELAWQFVIFITRQFPRDAERVLSLTKARSVSSKKSLSEEMTDSILQYVQANEVVFYRKKLGSMLASNLFKQPVSYQEIYRSREDLRALLKQK